MRRFLYGSKFDFIQFRRTAYIASAIALLVGLIFAVYWQATKGSWLNYGVDFTGGTLIQVRIGQEASVADVREVVETVAPGSEVTEFGNENEFQIRTPQRAGEATIGGEVVPDALRERFGAQNVAIESLEAVGAKVGSELQTRALIAVLVSFAATLIYLAFRFEWRFGLASVIATAHDILLTLTFIAVLRLEVALPTVAAVLTIVGYSLNDTIVIFDRIRENLRGSARHMPFVDLLNLSINETLPRTVLTGSSTLATLFALFFFGGEVIREFALILIFGIVVGTYSSIFVASPALLEIEKRWPAERKKARVQRVRAAH
jgi:preprotein translocase subunit SecF